MGNTKQMQMNLVVNASKAMTTLNEVNDALALIGNTEKLKGLSQAFENVAQVISRARNFTEELDKTTAKVLGDVSKDAAKAQSEVAKAFESTSKQISSSVDKNAHDMGGLLALQDKLAKSASKLGQVYQEVAKSTDGAKLTPKVDEASARKEIAQLEGLYQKHYDKLLDMQTQYEDKYAKRYKTDGKGHKAGDYKLDKDGEPIIDYSKWYNSDRLSTVIGKLTDYQYRMAELEKQMGRASSAKKRISKFRNDLDTLNYVPSNDEIHFIPEGEHFTGSKAESIAKQLAERETNLFTNATNATKKANEEGRRKFEEEQAEERRKLEEQITNHVKKLMDIDPSKKFGKGQEWAKKLVPQIADRMIMGQKLLQGLTKEQLGIRPESMASDMRDLAVRIGQTFDVNGYNMAGKTIFDSATEDLKRAKVQLSNQDALVKDLEAKSKGIIERFNTRNKLIEDLSKKKQTKTEKTEDAGSTENKPKKLKSPDTVISEFAEKLANAEASTVDLSKEFAKVAESIPVGKADELVKKINEAKKALVQTLNAMVRATNPPQETSEPKKTKSKAKTKEGPVDPQIKETAKDLQHAKDNWDKVNSSIPAPAIGEAAANAKVLETALLAITTMDYSKMTSAMDSISKTSAAMVKALSTQVKGKEQKEQEQSKKEKKAKVETFKQQRAELISSMEKQFTANPEVVKTKGWADNISKLEELTGNIIRMRMELGQVNGVVGDFKQALTLATNPQVIQTLIAEMDKYYASLERVNEIIRQSKANTPMTQAAKNDKAIADADAAWDALERQKLNQMDNMWKDYHKSRQTEQEKLNKASEKQISYYHALRDLEDRNQIKLITKEQTDALEKAQSLIKEYIKLKQKLDDTKVTGKEMSHGTYLKNARKEQEVIAKLKEKGIEAVSNYGSYDDYAKPLKQARAEEQAILELERKQTAEAKKHLQEIHKVVQQIREMRSILSLYKGESGDILSLAGYNSKKTQLTNLTDKLYSLTGEKAIAKAIRDSELANLDSVNRILPAPKPAAMNELKTQIQEAAVKAEQLYHEFEKTGKFTDKIRFQGAVKDLDTLKKKEDAINKALGTTESYVQKVRNILEIRANWMLGGMTAGMLMNLPSDLITSYRELEQAMAGVQQVMPLIEGNQKETNAEAERFINIAHEYARATDEVALAGQLWGRGYGKPTDINYIKDEAQKAGLDSITDSEAKYVAQAEAMKTTNELVAQSALLATVDNFSMEESVKGLESILSAYNMRAKSAAEATLFAGRAVDSITKVAHYGQISAQDLVQGIEATGKAAEQAGISLEFLEAMIETGVRNTGRSGAELGQAVKALTVGIYSKKGVKELNNFGINVTEMRNGVQVMRSAQSIILDISKALQDGNKNARNMLLAVSGGRYQYSKIASILSDESEILRMWGEAVNSKGFAREQLKVQMETLNAHIKQLKANFTSLIQEVMNSGAGEGAKWAIDTISSAVKLLTTHLDSAKMATFALIAAFTTIKVARFGASLMSMVGSVKQFKDELSKGGEKSSLGSIIKDAIPEAKNKAKNAVLGEQKTLTDRLRASVESETVAESKNTIAKNANSIATKGAVAGKATQVATERTLAGATNAVTAAELRQAAVTTVATMGLNLLVAGVIGAIGYMASFDSSLEEQEKRIESLTGKTQQMIQDKKDEEAGLEQEIATRRESVQYMDKAIEVYDRLKKSNDAMVASKGEEAKMDETWKKNKAEMVEIESNFSDILGADASKRIKESSDVKAAYTEEKNNYVKSTDQKVKTLADMQKEVRKYYTERAQEFAKQKEVYVEDLRNFGHWCEGQLNGLSLLETAWAKFSETNWRSNKDRAERINNQMNELREQAAELRANGEDDSEIQHQLNILRPMKMQADEMAGTWEKRAENGLEIFGMKLIDGVNDKISQMSSKYAESVGQAHNDYTIDPNAIKGYLTDTDDKEYTPESGSNKKGKTGKGGHHKTPVGFGDVREQVYHNMALDGVVVQAGFDENTIKALSQMINGEDSSNLFGLGESDAMMAGFKMAQEIKKAGTNGGIPAVLEALGIDKSRMDELTNNAKWYKDNLDWSRGANEIFGASNGSDVASSMVADADAHLGEQWRGVDAGFDSNSTWETQCASWVSYEMQKHGITSINSANGDVIMEQAGGAYKAGEAPLNAGDIINWASHVGIYDGNGGYIARNSRGGIHHGSMEEAQEWFGNVLGRVDFNELAAQNGVNVGSKIPWVNSKAKQTIWNWEYDPKRHNSLIETQQNDLLEKKYQLELKEAEVQKQMYGETASYFGAVRNLEKQRLVNLTSYNEKFRVQFESNKKAFENYINDNEGLQSVLKDRGVGNFFDLSDEEQKELMKRLADSGSNLDKEMEKVLSWLISNRNKVGENQIAVDQQAAKVAGIEGHMTPQQREDYDIAMENDRYELSKGWWDSSIDDREHYEKIASIYEARLARQQADLDAEHVKSENRQNDLLTQIDELGVVIKKADEELNKLEAKANPTNADKAEIRRLNKELTDRREELNKTTQSYNDLRNNGTDAERTLQQAVNKTARDYKAAVNQSMAIEREIASSLKGSITSTFSNMLLEGQSFQEGWQSLWKNIAQIAIRQLLEVWLFQKVLGLGVGRATGGSVAVPQPGVGIIKGRANGGLVGFADGGFTDGLIKGAGTGTSDSILTYLAHRGQFIKTSNGEYIIQKSSVDKLGVPFLDMLNQNPDALKSMKKYADGGSLGTQMSPSMKLSTMDSYRKYNANKMVTNQNQNKRLEELMQQQNDLISNMSQDESNGGLVVLNTHASSEDVLKALKENPRAVQAVLGKQQRMGFR